VERKGTPLTTNHYFNDNLQKARVERLKTALKGQAPSVKFGNEHRLIVNIDTIVHSVHGQYKAYRGKYPRDSQVLL